MNINVRPSGKKSFRLVGIPQKLAENVTINDGKLLYGGFVSHPSGAMSVLSAYPNNLRATNIDVSGGVVHQRLNFQGDTPSCCLSTSAGLVVTSPKVAPQLHRFEESTGRFRAKGFSVTRPPFAIVAELREQFTATSADLKLAGSYSAHDSRLNEADARTVGRQLSTLYSDLATRAAAARLYLQPLLAQYRLKDAAGQTLYESAPVLLVPPGGLQCLSSSSGRITTGSTALLTGLSLTARGFAPKLVKADDFEAGLSANVAEVELLLSPQLHPIDSSAGAATLLGSVNASTLSLSAWLPGAPRDVNPGAPGGWVHSRIRLLLTRRGAFALSPVGNARLEDYALTGGFDTLHATFEAQTAHLVKVMDAIKAHLDRLGSDPEFASTTRKLMRMQMPHSFGARSGAASGDTIIWGGLHRIPFRGYNPSELAASVAAASSSGVTSYEATVRLAHEGEMFRVQSPAGTEITAFSPLLVYPDGEATQLTITAGFSGRRFSLLPSADGSTAFFLSPDLLPVDVSTFSTLAEQDDDSTSVNDTADSSLVGLASGSSPDLLTDIVDTSAGEIVAVAAAPRANGGLEFGRNIFYAFGSCGTDIIRVNSSRNTLTAMRVDDRPIASSTAVAPGFGQLAVIAGSDLVVFSSSHRPVTLCRGVGGVMLGYEPVNDEYWCVEPYSDLSVILPAAMGEIGGPEPGDISQIISQKPQITVVSADGSTIYKRSNVSVESLLNTPGHLLIATPARYLLDASREESGSVAFSFSRDIALPRRCGATLGRLDTGLTGEGLSGTVTVSSSADINFTAPRLECSASVSGKLHHSLQLVLATPHAHFLRLTFSATSTSSETVAITIP